VEGGRDTARSRELRRVSVNQVQADCVASDLQDGAVKRLMALLKGSPSLTGMDVVETINESVMTAVEMNVRHAARRARLEQEAAEHLARFEAMNLKEREAARHDGDLELYAEDNLLIREALFDSPKISYLLDQWWRAAETYIDRGKHGTRSGTLTFGEYALYHTRLHRIVEHHGGEAVSEDEAKAIMEEDFKSDDTGKENAITREEFRYSVFQLADQWTYSLDEEDYVDFLRKGYQLVFKDLIETDKPDVTPEPPTEWSKKLPRKFK